LSRDAEEFLPLGEEVVRAVAGPHSRHVALLEDGLKVLVETPGGGVRLRGDQRARTAARRAVNAIAARVGSGAEVGESDVRAAINAARAGDERPAAASGPQLPIGRRGAIAAKTAAQAAYLDMLASHELTFGVGPAGTGKTFLAVAYGASLLMRGEVDRLVVTRPAVEAGERLGFLPGDLTEKVDPYLAPIWEALGDIMGAEPLRRRRERGEVEVAPIAFMRGRTLAHAFVIVDEAQNTSRMQMKMVLTRLGEGARMAVTGDPTQVDLLNGSDSGLSHAIRILDGVKGVAVARFSASDVVRHPLVERIVKAYDADAARSDQRRSFSRSGEDQP
jgi:phosphate starvation-inducible protein PhoH and related proteins